MSNKRYYKGKFAMTKLAASKTMKTALYELHEYCIIGGTTRFPGEKIVCPWRFGWKNKREEDS